jgi:hypothetical protein
MLEDMDLNELKESQTLHVAPALGLIQTDHSLEPKVSNPKTELSDTRTGKGVAGIRKVRVGPLTLGMASLTA